MKKTAIKLFAVIFTLTMVLGCFTACGDVPAESLDSYKQTSWGTINYPSLAVIPA